jgi:importin subunit beta-1
MTMLLENLQSDVLDRNVKIPILICFGDIALAIGAAFEPYLDTTMGVLRQAGAIQPNPVSSFSTSMLFRRLSVTISLA